MPGLRQDRPGARLYSARLRPQLLMQGGAWGNEPETANASLELMQIRFQNVDVPAMKTWLQNWSKGTKKDGFGMPKTMLPLGVELVGEKSACHHFGCNMRACIDTASQRRSEMCLAAHVLAA